MPLSSIADRLTFDQDALDIEPVGLVCPPVSLCELIDQELAATDARTLLGGSRVAVLGVPGAFTPVCTKRHLPEFVAAAASLRAVGFTDLFCIAPNAPWAVAHWAKIVDPLGQLRFVSDGNLDFTRAFGLTTVAPDLFLGACSKRFLMSLRDGFVERIRVERRITDISRTSVSSLFC